MTLVDGEIAHEVHSSWIARAVEGRLVGEDTP